MMHRTTTQTTLNLTMAPAHVVLAAAGKTVLRPGGRAATEQLLQWANFKPGETVLELASGLGNSAIALAKRYNVQVLGIEKDADRVAIAQAKARSLGLDHQVQFRQGNIFELESLAASFDCVLAEAILTNQRQYRYHYCYQLLISNSANLAAPGLSALDGVAVTVRVPVERAPLVRESSGLGGSSYSGRTSFETL